MMNFETPKITHGKKSFNVKHNGREFNYDYNFSFSFNADLNTSAWIMKTILEIADDKDTITRKTGVYQNEYFWSWSFSGIDYYTIIEILKILDKREDLPEIDDPIQQLFDKRDMFRVVKEHDKY